MAAPVEAAQAHQLPEARRNIVVKEQDAVFRTYKGSGDPQEEPAEYPVLPLGQPAAQAGQEAVTGLRRPVERKAQAEVLHRDILLGEARPAQAPVEGLQHFPVAKAHRGFQAQPGGLGKYARQESSQPPVPLGYPDAGAVLHAQLHGTRQHLILPCRPEKRRAVLGLGQQSVGMVDADLRAGIDAVLAFPEFDQPCPAPVVEIHGEGVEHHLETGGHKVVEPGIAGLFLPGVQGGGEEAAAAVVHIAERFRQFLHHGTFVALIHVPDPADDLPPAEMTKQHTQEGKQK